MTFPMYMCVHEAAHAVIALRLGGFAEAIDMHPRDGRLGACHVSWPEDGRDLTREKLLTYAAGPAATAIFKRCSQDAAIFETGLGDIRKMKEIGDDSDLWFKEARALCRRHWRDILNLAHEVRHAGVLDEPEIREVLEVYAW